MSLREQAIKARYEHHTNELEQQRKEAAEADEQMRQQFYADFGMFPEKTENGNLVADGIVFRAQHCERTKCHHYEGRMWHWYICVTCPNCGEIIKFIPYEGIHNLAELGENLYDYSVYYSQCFCQQNWIQRAYQRFWKGK